MPFLFHNKSEESQWTLVHSVCTAHQPVPQPPVQAARVLGWSCTACTLYYYTSLPTMPHSPQATITINLRQSTLPHSPQSPITINLRQLALPHSPQLITSIDILWCLWCNRRTSLAAKFRQLHSNMLLMFLNENGTSSSSHGPPHVSQLWPGASPMPSPMALKTPIRGPSPR